MSRQRLGLALLALLVVVVAVLLSSAPEPGASTYGRRAPGLRLAHDYLAAKGHPVVRWEQPMEELPEGPATLVLALPTRVVISFKEQAQLERWLVKGGTLVLLGSGLPLGPSQRGLLQTLDLEQRELRDDAPLWWFAFRRWRQEVATLVPEEPDAAALSIRLGTHRLAPWTAPAWQVLQRYPGRPAAGSEGEVEGAPAVFWKAVGRGGVLVVNNGSAFGNAWLDEGDNLAALDALARELAGDGPLLFDEWHQGHQAAEALDSSDLVGPFELVVLQLFLLWALAAWRVSRPFGAPLLPRRSREGAVERDLVALASLHRRAGHAHEAGVALLHLVQARARRQGRKPADLPEEFSGGEDELLALARTIGLKQARHEL